jgi:hypothetical protein
MKYRNRVISFCYSTIKKILLQKQTKIFFETSEDAS